MDQGEGGKLGTGRPSHVGHCAKYPQAVYNIGFVKCKQQEWQYVQRVVAGIAHYFEPLEEVIRYHLIPALLGLKPGELDSDLRQTLTHSVKTGGLGILNPMDTAQRVHNISAAATGCLTASLIRNDGTFDIAEHNRTARTTTLEARKGRIEDELLSLTRRGEGNATKQQRDKRNTKNGAWLTVVPTEKNGTVLLANEWRDSVRLRYNFSPQGMQSHCDGCNSAMKLSNMLWHVRKEDSYMPDMIFYGTNSTTCVVKPQCLPSAYANPTFTCVPVSQGNELPVDHLLLLHFPHKLQPLLRSEGMSAALAFGDLVVKRYSIYESLTPMPSHIYQLKSPRSSNVRKRRRRVSI